MAFRMMYLGDLKEAEEKKRCFQEMRAVRVCVGAVGSWPEAVTERLVKGHSSPGRTGNSPLSPAGVEPAPLLHNLV